MKSYTRNEALLRMNQFGAEGRPFVFMIDYKQETAYIEEPAAIDPNEWLYQLNGFSNVAVTGTRLPKGFSFHWQKHPLSFECYADSFHTVTRQIRAGNSYLVNLTCATPVETNLTIKEIFHYAIAPYKVWLKDRFVVFSPEIFIRLVDGHIYSYPMKGTLDASLPDACTRLLSDPKEAAEHATIVDLIRNDLSQVATSVTVSRYRYIDELQTNSGRLLQVSSEISGRLPEDWTSRLGELLFCQLPAGSITGAPKVKTRQIIAEAEGYERGFYTGVMGYFDGWSLDSAVMIRFIEQTADGLLFKSGGGITSQSDLLSEYNEMKQKVYVPIY
ncbi:MAG: aminodeoxychorismate synthase component I [Tannerellaceae bacterium]